MDPKSTATVGSAAVATVEDDLTSTAVVGVAGGRVERGAQGRSATHALSLSHEKCLSIS